MMKINGTKETLQGKNFHATGNYESSKL